MWMFTQISVARKAKSVGLTVLRDGLQIDGFQKQDVFTLTAGQADPLSQFLFPSKMQKPTIGLIFLYSAFF